MKMNVNINTNINVINIICLIKNKFFSRFYKILLDKKSQNYNPLMDSGILVIYSSRHQIFGEPFIIL